MKHTTILISILAIAACGGKKQPTPEEPKEPEPESPPVAETKKAPPEPEEPAPPPPPPPPQVKTLRAQAELTPVKGANIKGATVTFAQEEGQQTMVGSNGWFEGIKSGKYHLVVHDGTSCGPNATKAGKPMAKGDIPLVAAKGMDSVDIGKVDNLQLSGDTAIIGHTLVLHDDKKGKPGKALACGTIASAGD
jgi:hypothetical protein